MVQWLAEPDALVSEGRGPHALMVKNRDARYFLNDWRGSGARGSGRRGVRSEFGYSYSTGRRP